MNSNKNSSQCLQIIGSETKPEREKNENEKSRSFEREKKQRKKIYQSKVNEATIKPANKSWNNTIDRYIFFSLHLFNLNLRRSRWYENVHQILLIAIF